MRVLIVEDMALVAERIAFLAKTTFPKPIDRLDIALSYEQAEQRLQEQVYDVVFLDLNLHGRQGFGLLRQDVNYKTIVVTANDHEAARAYDLGVFDFIRKPITEKRFALAVNRLLLASRMAERTVPYLAVKSRGRIDMVAMDEIDYIKAAKNYAEIVLKTGATLLHEHNIQRVQQLLPKDFLRVHRSYLVVRSAIKRLINHGGGRYQAQLTTGTIIPLNRDSYRLLGESSPQAEGTSSKN